MLTNISTYSHDDSKIIREYIDIVDKGSRKGRKGEELLSMDLTRQDIFNLDLSQIHPQVASELIDKYSDIFAELSDD